MSCNLDYIDPTNEYKKRFPTDCKDKTPNTKHLLNDKHADVQLYALYQSLSYSAEIKNDKGEIIGHETRVNVKDVPSQAQIGKLLGMTRKTVREHQKYLLNPSTENIYCPYIILSEDGAYYILPEKESKYAFLPQPIIQYLLKGFSQDAIRTYIFFFAMNNWFQYERQKEKEEQQEKIKLQSKDEQATKKDSNNNINKEIMEENQDKIDKDDKQAYFTFYLGEVARNIGIKYTTPHGRNDVLAFDEERAKIDPNYKLGTVPTAMIALRNGKLIEWDITHDEETGHKLYRLLKVNTDITTIIPYDPIKTMTKEDIENRKTSKKVIKKYGAREEEKILKQIDTSALPPYPPANERTDFEF